LEFQASFPIKEIQKRKPNMWRYREAIPIEEDKNIVSFDEGFTPLITLDFGGRQAFIKQDYLFPTGSFKDRGASVLVSRIKELDIDEIIEDSSGNAGSAIAGYCARGHVKCDVYVPSDTADGKLAQIQLFGAGLHKISGSREDTASAALSAAKEHFYAGHAWNPYFYHGTKTFAFEVCEQLGWKAPDTLVLPIGNGTLLIGAYIGFSELLEAGIISEIPKIVGIQPANCAPLFHAFEEGLEEVPRIDKGDTLAEGIANTGPIRGKQILETVRSTGGSILAVSEAEIKIALKEMCARGFYIEPTSAAVVAGLKKYLITSEQEMVVSVFTGSGLKTTEKMLKIANES
jgi:threonine synthase